MKPIAIITGASSGIGRAYASGFASTHDLVLVARRKALLDDLSCELRQYGCHITQCIADLSKERDIRRLEAFIRRTEVDTLVNAAGFGDSNPFHQASTDLIHDMIYVHVLATTRLSRMVLPVMIRKGHGIIINVASVTGFSKLNAGNLVYNSAKAYLIRFSELLQQSHNLKDKVKIQVVCPGFTMTDFFKDHDHNVKVPCFLWMKAEEVVRRSIRKIRSGRTVYIPGWYNILISKMIGNTFLLPVLKLVRKKNKTLNMHPLKTQL